MIWDRIMEAFGKWQETRMGTYDADLNRIGDQIK